MLTIKEVSSERQGSYACQVVERKNKSRIVKQQHWFLIVNVPAGFPIITNEHTQEIGPSFIVEEGYQMFRLYCSATKGNPEPEVKHITYIDLFLLQLDLPNCRLVGLMQTESELFIHQLTANRCWK